MNPCKDITRKLNLVNKSNLSSLLLWLVLLLCLENFSQAQKQAVPDTNPLYERLPEKNEMHDIPIDSE